MSGSNANSLLGYPGDARLLIILNADDFAMSASVNQAVLGALQRGVTQSASLMVPWPGAAQAIGMLQENPDIGFGIHLSVICDLPGLRCSPVAPVDAVRSLTDGSGCFYPLERRAEFTALAVLGELETEFLMSAQARQAIEEAGIVLLDRELVRRIWASTA